MTALNDARCEKCNRKISWEGDMLDMPACRCGWQPDPEDLAKDQKMMEEFEELLLSNIKKDPDREV